MFFINYFEPSQKYTGGADNIPLCKAQKEIMTEFYSIEPTKVIFNKSERKKLWEIATNRSDLLNVKTILQDKCPALLHRIGNTPMFAAQRTKTDF